MHPVCSPGSRNEDGQSEHHQAAATGWCLSDCTEESELQQQQQHGAKCRPPGATEAAGTDWAGLGWLGWAGQHSAGSLNGNVSNSAAGWPPPALHWTPATSPGCRVNAELLQLNKYTKPRMIAPCEISMQTAHSARIIFSDSTGLLQLYLMWNCGIKIFLSDTFFL